MTQVHPGGSDRILAEVTPGAGTTSRNITIQSDQALVSYWVNSISGSLTINVYHQVDDGQEKLVLSFGPITTPSLVLADGLTGTINARVRIEAVYTGIVDYEIYIRSVGAAAFTDGFPLPVSGNVGIDTNGIVRSIYGTALAVASSGSAEVVVYTVPGGVSGYLVALDMSGTSIATYDITINGTQWARRRTYWSGPFQIEMHIGESLANAFPLSSGDTVRIQVTNFRPTSNDFEGRIQVIEK